MIFTDNDNGIAIFSLKSHRRSKYTQTQIHTSYRMHERALTKPSESDFIIHKHVLCIETSHGHTVTLNP